MLLLKKNCSMTEKITTGIIGAAGYTGGELLRILLLHPNAAIVFAQSRSQAGKPVWLVHGDLAGETDLVFSETAGGNVDVLFLCAGHGEAKKLQEAGVLPAAKHIIDLSQDFRLKKNAGDFVYGLPELNRERIRTAKHIANPGCFATAIQLALLPAAQQHLLLGDVHVSATTGSTGAGQAFSETAHFSWRSGNSSAYKVLDHQHLGEIGESILQLQPEFAHELCFVPYRGAFTRGILAGVYFEYDGTAETLREGYRSYYASHPFVWISDEPVHLKQVVNTNKCLLHITKQGKRIFITSIIDNLLKGASGQAVQNMNLLFGLPEKTGLQFKAVAF